MKKIMTGKIGSFAKRAAYVFMAAVIALGTFAGVSALESVETQAYTASVSINNFGLNSYAVTLYPKETFTLRTGNVGTVTYSSSDTSVASVSTAGKITAKAAGSAVITVTSASYGSRQCQVLVAADDGTYIDTLDNQIDYKMSTSEVTLTTSRAVINIDSGIAYSANLVNIID